MAGINESSPGAAIVSGDDTSDAPVIDENFVNGLLSAIKVREQEFDKGWWKDAKAAEKIYTADNEDNKVFEPYNILYSNTEVLLPSLYSSTPKPDVRERFRLNNLKPLPEMLDRFLTIAADPGNPGGDCFDNAMRDSVFQALVPGMGYVRLRYLADRAFPLVYEAGHYRTMIWGKASRWSKVPWVAFKQTMRREDMLRLFNKTEADDDANRPPISDETDQEKGSDVDVYELWNKKDRKIYFLCEQWTEKQLRVSDDPLGLENFYPTPGPLMMTVRGGKFLPIPLYNYYKEQAEELNRVSVRLIRVLSAIKVRGVYNPLLGDDLKKMLEADEMDNALNPAAEAGMLAQTGGLEKQIWFLPIRELVAVAQQLYQAREATKQVIYELTGISDIIRGSSVASETATAQDLKNKWGTVRLRRMQTVVADYARDLFRMSVDCGSDRIPAAQWKQITQIDAPLEAEKQVGAARMQQLMMLDPNSAMPAAAQPGTPPPPPNPAQQEIQKLQQLQSQPSIEDLLGRIKSDMNRTFVVNIQTSSTIDLDTAQDKSEVTEFMNSLGQLMPALQSLGALGPSGFEAAKAILLNVCLRFKFGIGIADALQNLQAPPPPAPDAASNAPAGPTPEEQQAAKAESDFKLAEIASKQRVLQAKESLELAQIEAQKQKLALDIQTAQIKAAAATITRPVANRPVKGQNAVI
jgi:hypothetical protein